MAEVDGNRTRQTGIARLSRFEGGGAHQVPRHLRRRRYRNETARRRWYAISASISSASTSPNLITLASWGWSRMILCWAAKGGSGTTVVACALALGSAHARPATLVDLSGDCATALGLAEPAGPGVVDWLASPTAGFDDLARLACGVANGPYPGHGVSLLAPRRHGAD